MVWQELVNNEYGIVGSCKAVEAMQTGTLPPEVIDQDQIVYVALPKDNSAMNTVFMTYDEAVAHNIEFGLVHRVSTSIELNVPLEAFYLQPFTINGVLKDVDGNPLSGKSWEVYQDGYKIPMSFQTKVDGTFDFQFMNLPVGTHRVRVVFLGDTQYKASAADGTIVVVFPPPELAEVYREYEIWTRPEFNDYTTPSPIDAAGSLEGVRAAIDRYIISISPPPSEPEPELAEVYRGHEIWTRPEFNDYTTPSPINAAGSLEGIRAAIDRYLAAHPELVWSAKTLQLFRGSGLTNAEIALVPPETSDLLEVELAVPKLAVLPSADEVRKKINDEMVAQGVEGEVVGIVVKLIKSDFFAFYEYQKAWVFVRSPLVVTGAISISLIVGSVLFGLAMITIIAWKWSDVKQAELRHQEITDINDVINNVLANPSLTDEQKQAIIDKLLETYQKATEEGKSWVDKLIQLAPIGLLGVGLLLLLSFMPKRKD